MKNKKLKILYIITKSNMGGAQRYVYELATSLPKDRFDVAVAFGGNGVLKEKLELSGVRTVTVKSFQRDFNAWKELKSFLELWRLYKTELPDIVHLNSSKAGGSGAFVARIAGVKSIIYTAHGWAFWEPRPFFWRLLVWLASWATAFFCHKIILVSQYEKKKTYMPFMQSKLSVIHTSVPKIGFIPQYEAREKLFQKETVERHKNSIWLITNAELNRNKNLFTAIDSVVAYNKSNTPRIFYSIMSDGELQEKLSEHINDCGASDYVTLLGYVDNGRIYLKAFDMFLLPSLKEGMPYALLEAGAAELPCIASNVGGIPEALEAGKSGLHIDPNNARTIIDALVTYAHNPDLRSKHAANFKQKVDEMFGFEKMFAATVRLYE